MPLTRDFDGAHWSPRPWVPWATLTMGRGPGPAHAAVGTYTEPVTAMGAFVADRVRYWMASAVTLLTPDKLVGAVFSTVPGVPETPGAGV